MTRGPIDAVIFDFDGVLVRSIELHALAYRAVLSPLRVPVGFHDIMIREGARSETIIQELAAREGIELPDEVVARLATLKQRVFQRLGEPQPYPVSRRVVEEIDERGFPLAIVTGTREENVPRIAPDLVPFFDALVTQGSYTQDKPHPEPYLTAAKALDVDPAACLVVENAPRGVQSARDAGMAVVAVTTTLPAEDLSRAHRIIPALEEILDIAPAKPGGSVEGFDR